jgi:hypothetical protein
VYRFSRYTHQLSLDRGTRIAAHRICASILDLFSDGHVVDLEGMGPTTAWFLIGRKGSV